MNHKVDPVRKFATATLALADIKETGKHLGVTINDLVLAMSAGALRQLLHADHGLAGHPLLAVGAGGTSDDLRPVRSVENARVACTQDRNRSMAAAV